MNISGYLFIAILVQIPVLSHILQLSFQIIFSWKDYFFDPNNYLEWTMYVSATFYLIPLTKDKTKAQTEAGAIAVLLAWINFVWFFKRLSLFGIYIIMAKKVFTSLLKVSSAYVKVYTFILLPHGFCMQTLSLVE